MHTYCIVRTITARSTLTIGRKDGMSTVKELGFADRGPGQLIKCCCLLLAGFIIGIALFFCGLLDWKTLGVWLFLMLAIACCCMCWC